MLKVVSSAMLLIAAMSSASVARADTLDPALAGSFKLETWLTGLTDITGVRFLPDGRVFVLEKGGALRLVKSDGTTVLAHKFSVDSASEKGLLGVAVQPDFESSHRVVVYWSRSDSSGGTHQKRHRVASFVLNGDYLDVTTERILIDDLEGPANHDGGALFFGPDGYLYIGTGDCGCNQTIPTLPTLHQNLRATAFNSLNGKVLRIAVDGTVPEGNPYRNTAGPVSGIAKPYSCAPSEAVSLVNSPVGPEIYALGFRNAFRLWVDPKTNNVWVGDVGEVEFEEINVITPAMKGGHYGWPFIEGPVKSDGPTTSICNTLQPKPGDCVKPTYACVHGAARTVNGVSYDGNCQSITGGLIVDSCQFPDSYRGKYYFADNVKGTIYSLDVNADRSGVDATSRKVVAQLDSGSYPVEFTVGPDGSLYVAVYGYGAPSRVVRIVPTTPNTCPADAGVPDGAIAPAVDAGFPDAGGAPAAPADPGCGCSTADTTRRSSGALAVGLALVGTLFARKRKTWFRVRG